MARPKKKSIEEQLVDTICNMTVDELKQLNMMIDSLINDLSPKTIEEKPEVRRIERGIKKIERVKGESKQRQARIEPIRITGENKFLQLKGSVEKEIPHNEKKEIALQQKDRWESNKSARATPMIEIDCDKCGKAFIMNESYYVPDSTVYCNACSSIKG